MDSRILSGNLDSTESTNGTTKNSIASTYSSSEQKTYKKPKVVPKKNPKTDDVLR